MDLDKKSKIALLKYKAIFEEEKLINNQLDLGNADLLYHLNFFKKKLKKDLPNQETIFNNTFFGNVYENTEIIANTKPVEESKNKVIHPKWSKKIYKQIVSITHPDKLLNIKIDTLVEKLSNCYLIAVSAYENYEYQNLIMVADDIGLHVDKDLVKKYIEPKIKTVEDKILKNKRLIGYHWYHIDEQDKEKTLESYLTKMGFVFTSAEVKNAIRKCREKSKRKVGTRPVKHKRIRLK